MFIKMGHRYVNMKRIESVTLVDTQLMIVSFSGQHYYRELPKESDNDKTLSALLNRIIEEEKS